jgi:hypothetical protein
MRLPWSEKLASILVGFCTYYIFTMRNKVFAIWILLLRVLKSDVKMELGRLVHSELKALLVDREFLRKFFLVGEVFVEVLLGTPCYLFLLLLFVTSSCYLLSLLVISTSYWYFTLLLVLLKLLLLIEILLIIVILLVLRILISGQSPSLTALLLRNRSIQRASMQCILKISCRHRICNSL